MTIDDDDQRVFHNEKSSTYWFPKDEDEQQRLTGVNEINVTCTL